MLRNYFKIAYRSLKKNAVHSVINVAGLALGITCCIMIFLVIRFELSYDAFHSKANRIYRVNSIMLQDKNTTTGAPLPVAGALKREFPEVEQATSTFFINNGVVKAGEQVYQETGITYVAPEYFSIMDVKWIAGNQHNALAEPNSVVLTKSLAQKYFGGSGDNLAEAALGKTIKLNIAHTLKVTGLVEDVPANTDFPFNIMVSQASLNQHYPDLSMDNWEIFSSDITHFVLLRAGTDPGGLEKKFAAIDKKYKSEGEAAKHTQTLQPLREVHYDERFSNHNGRIMAKENIAGLVLISAFIMLTACINFINLATAQSVNRSKEVGVRKVLGANRKGLLLQFLSETTLLSILACVLAIALGFLVAPQLKNLLQLQFSYNPFKDAGLLLFLFSIMLTVSVLAGIYPAFVLSGYKPILALKNKAMAQGSTALVLRRGLIVIQFGIAQLLIICTIIVSNQLEFFRSKPLGFNKDAIITIPFSAENNPAKYQSLRNELQQLQGVQSVSFSLAPPTSKAEFWTGFKIGSDPKEYYGLTMPVDENYVNTYGLSIVAGKDMDATSDSADVLVNETLLKWANVQDVAGGVGAQLKLGNKVFRIRGVIKDFYTASLHKNPAAMIMMKHPAVQIAGIKINPADMRKTIAAIGGLWKKTYPESVFKFDFLDDTIAGYYQEEVKMFNLFTIFSGIAIFISCLGLYALVSFMAVQRIKEIGIRKVVGASIANIVGLFTKEFFVLILIAFFIAAPLGWYIMNNWLQNFQNQITMGPSSFILSIVFSLIIAGITIVYRSARAASANPVKSLRSE